MHTWQATHIAESNDRHERKVFVAMTAFAACGPTNTEVGFPCECFTFGPLASVYRAYRTVVDLSTLALYVGTRTCAAR